MEGLPGLGGGTPDGPSWVGGGGHLTPTCPVQEVITEEGSHLPRFVLAAADRKLIDAHRDTVHQNDVQHLDGGLADNPFLQQGWLHPDAQSTSRYDVPKGREGITLLPS
mmetsp:Transcript_25319/g.74507  ORF Transcript_25319/g.74507 Transcript_25319/m.74507 type:complete len:109 (+) Transcript_25319:1250-1576(+)